MVGGIRMHALEAFFTNAGTWGFGGIGFGVGFFAVRWAAVYAAQRWDKREAQIDAGMQTLIEQLKTQVTSLFERLDRVERELAECKAMHAKADAERMRLEGLVAGLGDARQHAALIIASEKKDAKE